jgi:hypothetical protein
MNKIEIANLFIRAAFIDSRLPIEAGPKRLKAAWVKYAARTEAEQRKWFISEPTDEGANQIHKLDKGPIHDWWMAFWDGRSVDTSRNDYRLWELANEMMTLVAEEQNRRALWAWAMSKVGTLQAHQTKTRYTAPKLSKKLGKKERVKIHKRTSRDVSFAAWCQSEGIHEETGRRRKDRALSIMEQYLVRGSSQNAKTPDFTLLPVGGVLEHISDNIAADAPSRKERFIERDRDTVFCKDFTIAEFRKNVAADNRRKADLRRRQVAA